MPRTSPYTIELTNEERRALEARARKYTLPYRDVFRAQIVLFAAQGLRNDEIARRLNTRRDVVSGWRKRFFEERLASAFTASPEDGLRRQAVGPSPGEVLSRKNFSNRFSVWVRDPPRCQAAPAIRFKSAILH